MGQIGQSTEKCYELSIYTLKESSPSATATAPKVHMVRQKTKKKSKDKMQNVEHAKIQLKDDKEQTDRIVWIIR